MPPNQELLDKAAPASRVEEFRTVEPGPIRRIPHSIAISALGTICVIYVVLRSLHLGSYSLWYDEAFSAFVAKSPWRDLFRQVILDRVHPPLYYMLLKVWIAAVGASVVRLRLFSVFFAVLTLFPLWSCMRQMRLAMNVRLALLLAIACNPFLVFYSQEVRMYSLVCFLSVWSLDLYLKQKRDHSSSRILWVLVNIALVMAHVAGIAVVGCEIAHAALARRDFRDRFLACLPAFIALAGWIAVVKILSPAPARVLDNVEWISKLTVAVQWETVTHLLGSRLGVLALNLPVVIAIWTHRRIDRRYASLFLMLSAATIAFVFAFSVLVKPIWQERYLIIAVLPYYLLTGDSIRRINPKWALRCTLAIAVIGMLSLEYDSTHRPDRPVFTRFTAPKGQRVFASDDLAGAPLAIRQGSRDVPIEIIKAAWHSGSGGLKLTVREVSYSIGERESLIQRGHDIYERDFLYAYDTTLDPLSPPGLLPSTLASYGCSEKEVAETHGEGREFVLLKINCT